MVLDSRKLERKLQTRINLIRKKVRNYNINVSNSNELRYLLILSHKLINIINVNVINNILIDLNNIQFKFSKPISASLDSQRFL